MRLRGKRAPAAPAWAVETPTPEPRGALWRVRDALRARREPSDVKAVLVDELANNFWPSVVVAGAFVSVGVFAGASLASTQLSLVTALGTLFALTKLTLIVRHRGTGATADRDVVQRWDRLHALSGLGFAAALGTLDAMIFASHDHALQMLATGLLFAYCAGIVGRVSVRPRAATLFLLVAALPVILATALDHERAHWMLMGMFALFLAAGIETIWHLHRATARQIGLRLDMTVLAQHDPLTGLRNRLGLRQAYREITSTYDEPMLAVHCFDLDRFKPINDRYGHAVGDLVLQAMAERVGGLLLDGYVAARIGGDEFVVVQGPIRQAAEADLFARRLARVVAAPYRIGTLDVEIGVSLGYAVALPGALDLEPLIALADHALYRMKLSGGGVAHGEAG
ncbi:GGDEF domain-containing protein [Sphingomonas sp. RB3P16]|uniref:GGDEF domain-containing protein n=1 Tax=Parasphingomonas frigoris TaxID=3096163 RepID=UPI002FC92EDB